MNDEQVRILKDESMNLLCDGFNGIAKIFTGLSERIRGLSERLEAAKDEIPEGDGTSE